MDNENLLKLNQLLTSFLGPQIKEVVDAYGVGENYKKYFVEIPEVDNIDLGVMDMANLVAKTSNAYGRAARFAGMARAHFKLTEGKYKAVYKKNRIGKNEAEREAAAMLAAEEQYQALIVAESLVHLAESMETSSRIASESARKLMDKMQSMQVATAREEKGFFLEKDFEF